MYVPHLDFLEAGKFKQLLNDCNLAPNSDQIPEQKCKRINLGSLSQHSGINKQLLAEIFGNIFRQLVSLQIQTYVNRCL